MRCLIFRTEDEILPPLRSFFNRSNGTGNNWGSHASGQHVKESFGVFSVIRLVLVAFFSCFLLAWLHGVILHVTTPAFAHESILYIYYNVTLHLRSQDAQLKKVSVCKSCFVIRSILSMLMGGGVSFNVVLSV